MLKAERTGFIENVLRCRAIYMAEYEKYLERAYEALESAKILFENGKYNVHFFKS